METLLFLLKSVQNNFKAVMQFQKVGIVITVLEIFLYPALWIFFSFFVTAGNGRGPILVTRILLQQVALLHYQIIHLQKAT